MFESIKTKLWELLSKKDVSLAMLYNREGEILWHKGRRIVGRNINEGEGFSKTYLNLAIAGSKTIEEKNVIIKSTGSDLPKSASILNIKSILIQPISQKFFLYIDSGIKDAFSDTDTEVFKAMGWLLGEMVENIEKNEKDSGGISGASDKIEQIRDYILKYSLEDEPVLLLGETGSGKSHMAQLIHKYSGRKGKFFTVNTPGIPHNLFESELFGHRKGAFTDAREDKKGYVNEAEGGTLFFDEISEVPLSFQAKLLRFIETRKYTVLGDAGEKTADLRIVAATNKDIFEAIRNREFRQDLYYRLSVLEVEIPSLRERKEDIKILVQEHLDLLKSKEIGDGFWEELTNYNWPGNIRELLTVLTRAGILLESPITGRDIRDIINQGLSRKSEDVEEDRLVNIKKALGEGKTFWEVVKIPFLARRLNCSQVRRIIDSALHETRGTYKDILKPFNIKDKDYKKFLNFLNVHKIMQDSTDG